MTAEFNGVDVRELASVKNDKETRMDWARRTIIDFCKTDLPCVVVNDWHNNGIHSNSMCKIHYSALREAIYDCGMSGAIGVFYVGSELHLIRANAITRGLLESPYGRTLKSQFSRLYINAVMGLGVVNDSDGIITCRECAHIKALKENVCTEHGEFDCYCEKFGRFYWSDNLGLDQATCPHAVRIIKETTKE